MTIRIIPALFSGIFILSAVANNVADAQAPTGTAVLAGESSVGLASTQLNIAVQQLQQGLQELSSSLTALKTQAQKDANELAYWRDACQSTPACGGPIKK